VRVRPFNQREKDLGAVNIIEMVHDGGKQQLKINDKCRGPTVHTFDFCFWSFSASDANFVDQESCFDIIGLDILAKVGLFHLRSVNKSSILSPRTPLSAFTPLARPWQSTFRSGPDSMLVGRVMMIKTAGREGGC
jgi:hypothetical protein